MIDPNWVSSKTGDTYEEVVEHVMKSMQLNEEQAKSCIDESLFYDPEEES